MNTTRRIRPFGALLVMLSSLPWLRASDDMSVVLRVMHLSQVEQAAIDSQREQIAKIETALFEAYAVGVTAKSFDADRNNRINVTGYRAFERAVWTAAQKDVRVLQRYDADHDGKLNRKEWAVARTDLLPL